MPMYLTLTLHRAADGHGGVATKGDEAWMTIARSFVEQFGWGALIGIASGFTMALLLQHVAARDTGGGILALLGLLVTSSELARHLCGGVWGCRNGPPRIRSAVRHGLATDLVTRDWSTRLGPCLFLRLQPRGARDTGYCSILASKETLRP
jgi:hypothetical protein